MGSVKTNFLISILALLSVSVFFTTSGALFQSRVASPMKELVLRLEDPCSINLPFVTPLVVLESIGVDCLIIERERERERENMHKLVGGEKL